MWYYAILAIFFVIVGLIALDPISGTYKNNMSELRKALVVAFFIIIGIFLSAFANSINDKEYNSKKYSFKQEIRKEIRDSTVVKTDTLYIIKKKR